jgi:hypothetical protein
MPRVISNGLKNIVGSINQSFPGLLQRMHGQRLWAKEREVWVRKGATDVNQTEVNEGLCRIAAKLALAIYYETRLHPASTDCRINTQSTHCQNVDTVKHVQDTQRDTESSSASDGQVEYSGQFFLKVPLREREFIFSRYLSSIGSADRAVACSIRSSPGSV